MLCLLLQGWGLSESWKYCIDYVGVDEEQSREGGGGGRGEEGEGEEVGEGGEEGGEGGGSGGGGGGCLHSYRVQYSEPTRRQPVPIATASVYFFLKAQGKVRNTTYSVRGRTPSCCLGYHLRLKYK